MHALGLVDLTVGFDHAEIVRIPRHGGIEIGHGDADVIDGDDVIGGNESGRIGSAHSTKVARTYLELPGRKGYR